MVFSAKLNSKSEAVARALSIYAHPRPAGEGQKDDSQSQYQGEIMQKLQHLFQQKNEFETLLAAKM